MAKLFEHGQGRVDHAWAGTVAAADRFLDRLDDLVAVTGLLGDERQNHEAKIAMIENPAEPAAAAMTASMIVVGAMPTAAKGATSVAVFMMSIRISVVHVYPCECI
jgi:hypothetical protein